MGKGSTGDEREMAKRIAQISDPDPEIVYEGQEKADFWSLLGGKGSYTDERVLKNIGEATTPRLFHGSNASGTFKSKLQRVKKNFYCLHNATKWNFMVQKVEFVSSTLPPDFVFLPKIF